MEKKTINEWMTKLNVRPAIHNEDLYADKNLYTIEEFNKKIPYNTQVPLFVENNSNELVKVNNGEITVAQELVNQIVAFQKESLKMKLIEDDLKAKIKTAMEENGIEKSFEIGELKVSYRKASTRTTIDSKKLKEDLPDIYEEYSKTSNVSSSISISVE